MNPGLGLAALVVVLAATVGVGVYGLRLSRTTSDFYVASREISPLWNASAIGGEYLSAASFLGVAGLVMAYGVDMLAYPVGYTAGYLVLLLLVAAPLRRSGAYTLPDFAEERLGSAAVRRVASVLVVVIAWLYLVPQLQGAGLTLRTVTGAPRWVGAVVVAVAVVGVSAAGGMRSVTLVQGFQFWLKLTAIAVPAVFLVLAWRSAGTPSLTGPDVPRFSHATAVPISEDVRFDVRSPVTVIVRGGLDGATFRAPGTAVRLADGEHTAAARATLTFPAGAVVPHQHGLVPASGARWASPLSGAGGRPHPLYAVYSILLATFLGTMGLPHVVVRFYTNPDGQAARRTTLLVLVLLSVFYLLPTVYGALGRIFAPQLLLTGQTDTAVLVLPQIVQAGEGGRLLGALVAAGAFAAFVSTASGLTVSVAGVVSQDLMRGSTRGFRWASLAAGVPPLVMATMTAGLPVADAIGLAFAVAASSFCPLLVLGIWWRGLTDRGALLGLVAGGGLAALAVVVTSVRGPGRGWSAALLEEPAAWTVPVAFAVMVSVSLLTRRRISPAAVDRVMLRMHLPEEVAALPDHAGPLVPK
ncbi:Sodium:solute symporter family protein [Streptomyces sp. DvalAA-14]|uniref:sodium/solute symporter n=1 Tax=unclassified Streptomyces TaxID=2593676 RepID=UPI00081B70A6|nr:MULTISPECIES: cation acetate symporter [unclassified Streptomyces]MYS20745.1 cation acetate symporter [Streptomyces sp. SID4948]SCD76200.1 Sodium:solute symporter family protein [Streptomyces sp. DvalAA-14]